NDRFCKSGAIDNTIDHRSRKQCLHQWCSFPGVELMDSRISIVHRNAFLLEHLGSRAFAHPYRAGKAKNDQCPVSMSATMMLRSSAVTSGHFPNQRAKPGAA